MLKLLRKKGVAKKIIWVIAIVIIISFGFMGTAYLLTGNSSLSYAGKIFGKKVEIEDFQKMHEHVRIQAIMKYGDKFRDIQQFLNLENETWDRLILLHEVNKRKIKINDAEVVKAIEAIPFFQRSGQFDTLLYNDIVRFNFQINPRNFEESMRDTLKFSKLFEDVTKDIMINETEIIEEYKKINEKAQVSYVLFSPAQYNSEITFEESAAKEYFENNKLNFILPESINLEYFDIPLTKEVAEGKTDAASTENQESPNDAVRKKAQAVYEDLLINQNIQEVAKEHNLTPKQTGYFSPEEPNLSLGWSYDIINQAFKLNAGQIAGPFETENKIIILKAKEKRDSSIPSYDEVREKVKKAYLTEKALVLVKSKANEYLQLIKQEYEKSEAKDFSAVARVFGLEITQTPVFTRGQYLPKIGISKDFEEVAFSLNEKNKISNVVTTEAGICILYLDQKIAADEKKFETQNVSIREKLLNEKRNEMFSGYITHLRSKAKLESNLDKLRANR